MVLKHCGYRRLNTVLIRHLLNSGVYVHNIVYPGQPLVFICRIDELFDILVEFPDSEPALLDLRDCLMKVELRTVLINSLQAV
jgi:hypothetical protein